MAVSIGLVLMLLCFGVAFGDEDETVDHSVESKIYRDFQTIVPCFRLVNGTHQIGCSASASNTRGMVYYVPDAPTLHSVLHDDLPHSPYIVMLEPDLFNNRTNLVELKASKNVNGVIVRNDLSTPAGLQSFSPQLRCPNEALINDSCKAQEWNPFGNELSYFDFGDFPIFALSSVEFEMAVECYREHNVNFTGSNADFPLCHLEMTADMFVAKSTEVCFRKGNVPTFYLSGSNFCDSLGDQNVWNTLFEIDKGSNNMILVATKLDSSSFFPYLSYGANNDVSGIATLLAVVDVLGRLKKQNVLLGTERPIVFVFFHGESWDYIGSSRMEYDMQRNKFPYDIDGKSETEREKYPPTFGLDNITDVLELSQLGIQAAPGTAPPTFYVHDHPSNSSSLLKKALYQFSGGTVSLSETTASTLPPASIQMFLRQKRDLNAVLLSDYDKEYNSRFFGSRYDSFENLAGNESLTDTTPVVQHLKSLATVVSKALLNISGPVWNTTAKQGVDDIEADSEFVKEVIECFLFSPNCSLFRKVLNNITAQHFIDVSTPMSRYVTTSSVQNNETVLVFQLLSYLTGTVNKTTCESCLDSIKRAKDDNVKRYNITWMQGDVGDDSECLCVTSYTHFHDAVSPFFDDHQLSNYSTWAESRWNAVTMRMYLVTYALQEVALFFCGLAMSAVVLGVAAQCNIKGSSLFQCRLITAS